MAITSHYCFYCSVRLGSIVAGILSLLQALIPMAALLIVGADNLRASADYTQQHMADYKKQQIFVMLLSAIVKDADLFIMVTAAMLAIYSVTCVIMIIGAIRLYKWLLLPYILLELVRLAILLTVHIVGMIVMRKNFNLGTLITTTVAGGFVLLYVLYTWICVVALFQIIGTVRSARYKALYGKNPLAPLKYTHKQDIVENVRMYPAPDFTKTTPLKLEKIQNEKNITHVAAMSPAGFIFESDFKAVHNRDNLARRREAERKRYF